MSALKKSLGIAALAIAVVFLPSSTFAVTPGAQPTKLPAAKPKSATPAAEPAPADATATATPEAEAKPSDATPPAETVQQADPETARSAGSEPVAVESDIAEGEIEQGAVHLQDLDLGQPVEVSGKSNPFFQDSKIKLHARSYYFNRQRYDNSIAEAWALGGDISFKSGYLWDRFAVGATVYTSQPIHADDDRDGTSLLQPGQEGYTSLGQIYGEVKIVDGLQANFGRKEYNTPFINMHDVRMTPKTFQGVTLTGTHPGREEGSMWRYGGGYLYKMKDWTDQDFDWMSKDLGMDEDRGVITAGGNYSTYKWSVGAIDYAMPDALNIFYTEGSYGWKFSPRTSLKLSGQFVDQHTIGDDEITGESFDVQQWGVKADLGFASAMLTLAFTDVSSGDDENVRSPWGGYPGYTSVQVQDFNRAGEAAFMIKAAYDFTTAGLKGLSAYVLWVHGMDRSADGTFNEDEVDFNIQWAPKDGKMKDFSARLRYAEIMQRGGGDPSFEDFRVILNYNFNIK